MAWRWAVGGCCCEDETTANSTTTMFSLAGELIRHFDHGASVLHVDLNGSRVLHSGSSSGSGPTVTSFTYAGAPRLSWRRAGSGRTFEHRSLLFSDNNVAISGGAATDPVLWRTDEQVIVDESGNTLWEPGDVGAVHVIDSSDQLYSENSGFDNQPYAFLIHSAGGTLIRGFFGGDHLSGTGGLFYGRVALDETNGNIYIPSSYGVYAVDSNDDLLWSIPQASGVDWQEIFVRSDGDLIASKRTTNTRTRIVRIAAADGAIVWERNIFHTCVCLDQDDNIWVGLPVASNKTKATQQLAASGGWTGGTFTLELNSEVTAPIRWDANAQDIANALNDLPVVQATGFDVLGLTLSAARLPSDAVRVQFRWFGAVPLLVPDLSGIIATGTPALNVTQTAAGSDAESLRKYDSECDEILLRLDRDGGSPEAGELYGSIDALASRGDRVVAAGGRVAVMG